MTARAEVDGQRVRYEGGVWVPENDDPGLATFPNGTTETVLSNPVRHTLAECLAELRFGRPVATQEFLDNCIARLEAAQAIERVHEMAVSSLSPEQYENLLTALSRLAETRKLKCALAFRTCNCGPGDGCDFCQGEGDGTGFGFETVG